MKPARAMRSLFVERPDLCDATLRIAETCTFDLGLKRMHFPDFPAPAGRSASSVLAERCRRGIEDRDVHPTPEVLARLDHELAMIDEMGSSAFFLTVADIVADIKAMGIRCACRGSAAGSLVCYLTAISDVDPVRHDLPFERFMNPMRDEPPDIDIDVESARREDVYDMVLSRHGDDRAACVAMIDTYRARSAVREVGKALGLPDAELGVVAKAFPHISASHLREAIDRLPELHGINLPHATARAAVPRGRATGRVPAPHRAASVRHRPVEPRAGRPGAARTERERPPDDPGRQGRRRAARLPEARRPGHPDALLDAPRAGRDRAHHR